MRWMRELGYPMYYYLRVNEFIDGWTYWKNKEGRAFDAGLVLGEAAGGIFFLAFGDLFR